jgi:hypothetical protein
MGRPQFCLPVLDSRFYVETGSLLASGGSLPARPFFMSPGYTGFVALCAAVGHGVQATQAIQAIVVALQIVLDAAACVAVAWLAFRRRGAVAGFAAGLLLALHGPQIVFTTRVLDATMGAFLVALLALVCDRVDRDARARNFALAGLLVGLLALLRSTALLFVPIFLWDAWRRSRSDRRVHLGACACAFSLALLLPIVPVTIRNVVEGGEFVLLTSSGGVNFLIGNSLQSDGRFTSLNNLPLAPGRFDDDPSDGRFELSARKFASERSGHPLTAVETSRFYSDLAWREIASDRVAWGRLLLRKLWLFVNAFEVPQVDNVYFLARYVPWLRPLVESSRLLWPLALFGMVVAGWRGGPPLLRALFWTYAAAIALFFVTDRYRLWVTPLAACFAGAGVARIVEVARSGAWRARLGHGAALFAIGLVCNLNPALFEPTAAVARPARDRGGLFGRPKDYLDFRAQHNNMAARCLESGGEGDAEAAVAECDAGLALEPGDPTLRLNLRRALAAKCTGLYQRGEFARARPPLDRWIREAPRDPEAWNTLGATLLKLEEGDAGIAALRRAAELAPQELRYRYNLALALVRRKRLDDALPVIEAILAVQPDHKGALDLLRRCGK